MAFGCLGAVISKGVRRAFSRLRPLEWALLAFILWMFIAVGPQVVLELDVLLNPRTEKILEALILVGTLQLYAVFRRRAWRDPDARVVRFFRVSLILAVLPLVLMLVELVTDQRSRLAQSSETRAEFAAMMINGGMSAIGLGTPFLAAWLGVGVELKSPEGFSFLRLASDAASGVSLVLREFLPLALIVSGYAWIERTIGRPSRTFDLEMAAVDRALTGVDPHRVLEGMIRPWLSEWLAFAYSFYAFLYPLALGALLLRAGWPAVRPAVFAVGLSLLLGYMSFGLLPVEGPMVARKFEIPLDLYWLREVKETLMDATRIRWDCFPSLHTCITLILAQFLFWEVRKLFWVLLPVVVSIPFACVYLRYHYVADVVAGVVLFLLVGMLTKRLRSAGAFDVRTTA
jgi:membrane-associated phospholipid phosphatase